MKRVFCLGFAKTFVVEAALDVATGIEPLLLAEEDIIVVGYQMAMKQGVAHQLGNDGDTDCDYALTTTGKPTGQGVLAFINGTAKWNTVPAAVIQSYAKVNHQFPDSQGFSMKEGEQLSLYYVGHNTSAADIGWTVDGTIYYIKGKITQR